MTLHALLHKHWSTSFPGVGAMHFCQSRITRRWSVGLETATGGLFDLPRDLSIAGLLRLARATTNTEFVEAALDLGATPIPGSQS